ncbi:MAG: TerB family tellurite resistance protein [Deltaproteobacteria bacterium]|nr:TerB family tellurite resistance protein [Deltaproteobacteria bacterium]
MTQDTTLQFANLDASKLEAVVETMLLAAHADGEFSPEERAVLARTVESLTEGQLPQTKFTQLVERIAKSEESTRPQRIAYIKERLPDMATRVGALALAIRVTASDGLIRTTERELIAELAEGLGVDADLAADMVAGVR